MTREEWAKIPKTPGAKFSFPSAGRSDQRRIGTVENYCPYGATLRWRPASSQDPGPWGTMERGYFPCETLERAEEDT